MTDHVIRYVVTHIGKDGLRTLCGPAQGRITKEKPEDAQQLLDSMMQNNRMVGDRLAGVYGLPLEVRPVKCYPGHFDPMGVYFDLTNISELEKAYIEAVSDYQGKLASLENYADELHALIAARDALQAHPDFSGNLPETYLSGGDLDPVGVAPKTESAQMRP